MLSLAYTSQFKKDVRRRRRQGADLERLGEGITLLRKGEVLGERFRDHALAGRLGGHRECHIGPDWLLVYRIDDTRLILTAVRTGSHAELFGL